MCAFSASVARRARIFKIEHLTTPAKESMIPLGLPGPLRITSADQEGGQGGDGGFGFEDDPCGEVNQRSLCSTYLAPNQIAGLISTFVAEDSWANDRNSIKATRSKLVVVQTEDVLDQIESFLQVLYRRRSRDLEVEVAMLPPSLFKKICKNEKADFDAAMLPPELFDRIAMRTGNDGIVWRRTVEEGEQATFRPLFQRLTIKDIDVLGVAPSVNPLVGLFRNGPGIVMRCVRTPRKNLFLMDFVIARSKAPETAAMRRTPLGDLELAPLSRALFSGIIPAETGRTIVLGRFSWNRKQPEPFVAVARIRKVPAPNVIPFSFDIIETGALQLPWMNPRRRLIANDTTLLSTFFDDNGSGGYSKEERPIFTSSQLLKRAHSVLPPEIGKNPRLRIKLMESGLFVSVLGDGAETKRAAGIIRAHFASCLQKKTRMVTAELLQGTISADDFERIKDRGKGTVLLVPNWREKVALERETLLSCAGIPGVLNELFAGAGRRYVDDIEFVSGRAGGTVLEVVDPIVSWAGTGIHVALRVKPVPGTGWLQVQADGIVAETTFENQVSVYGDHSVKPGGLHGLQAAGKKMKIDLPKQKADRWRHVVTVPAGRSCLLNAFPDPKDQSKLRILVVKPAIKK